MFDKMKQLMEMKKQADQIKRDLDATITECTDVRGIKVVINGSSAVQSIEIEQDRLNPEFKSRFESDLTRAVNTAIGKSQQIAAKKMKTMLPAGFPGL